MGQKLTGADLYPRILRLCRILQGHQFHFDMCNRVKISNSEFSFNKY